MLLALGGRCFAQSPQAIVQEAVNAELAAARADHSHWRYLRREAGGNEFLEIETKDGAVSRHVKENGHVPSAETLRNDDAFNQRFLHDPAVRAKQRKDGEHDDKSATELLNEMPVAFSWKVESESPELINLSYTPNPNFSPPDMESRVMGGMTGTMVVSKEGHRIRTFKGRLEDDVTIGFGLLARLKAGSTFDIERRVVGEGYWEITETHVHINGHALFFKTIGTQEDEVKTDFALLPANITLEQAVAMLNEPAK